MSKLSWYGMTVLFGMKNCRNYSNLGGFLAEIIPQHLTDAENIERTQSVAFGTDGYYSDLEREIASKLLKYWVEKGCPGLQS